MWGLINCVPPLENTGIALQLTFVLLPPVSPLCHSFLSGSLARRPLQMSVLLWAEAGSRFLQLGSQQFQQEEEDSWPGTFTCFLHGHDRPDSEGFEAG